VSNYNPQAIYNWKITTQV